MVKQVVDRLLLESLVFTTSLESLTKGYLYLSATMTRSLTQNRVIALLVSPPQVMYGLGAKDQALFLSVVW
jgi:hypothetical protein